MVEGVTMHDAIRRVHVCAATAMLAPLVMYFATGYFMAHDSQQEFADARTTTRVVRLRSGGERDSLGYAAYLQDTLALRGQPQAPVRLEGGAWRFAYQRPGTTYEVVAGRGDSVRVTEHREPLRRGLTGFHRLRGYGGGWAYDLWAGLVDLAALSLLAIPTTGIYLWHRQTRRHLLGWLLLGGSLGYVAANVLYLLHAP
jgi:hypothetical protein